VVVAEAGVRSASGRHASPRGCNGTKQAPRVAPRATQGKQGPRARATQPGNQGSRAKP